MQAELLPSAHRRRHCKHQQAPLRSRGRTRPDRSPGIARDQTWNRPISVVEAVPCRRSRIAEHAASDVMPASRASCRPGARSRGAPRRRPRQLDVRRVRRGRSTTRAPGMALARSRRAPPRASRRRVAADDQRGRLMVPAYRSDSSRGRPRNSRRSRQDRWRGAFARGLATRASRRSTRRVPEEARHRQVDDSVMPRRRARTGAALHASASAMRGDVLASTRRSADRGACAASHWPTIPPSDKPQHATRSMPSAIERARARRPEPFDRVVAGRRVAAAVTAKVVAQDAEARGESPAWASHIVWSRPSECESATTGPLVKRRRAGSSTRSSSRSRRAWSAGIEARMAASQQTLAKRPRPRQGRRRDRRVIEVGLRHDASIRLGANRVERVDGPSTWTAAQAPLPPARGRGRAPAPVRPAASRARRTPYLESRRGWRASALDRP